MNTTELIGQVITALFELEAKGYHSVYFEYGNGLFRIRIFRGKVEAGTVVYERTVNATDEPSQLEEAVNYIRNLRNHVKKPYSNATNRSM
ncbi:MAG: hypothetical protein LBB73_01535 [Dysgonamonadaceae bacterium]|jgi:hypothetical protein|nr:hypothetical protein [Dysgonamonadaceae bacterium]